MTQIVRTLPALWLGCCLAAAVAIPLLAPSGPPKVADLVLPTDPPADVDMATLAD